MSPYSYPPLIAGFSIMALGVFVFLHNKKAALNRVFALMCFSIFIWLGSYTIAFSVRSKELALFWARFSYIGVIFIPITVHHISVLFLNALDTVNKKLIFVSYILGFLFLIISRTPLFFNDVYSYFWGYYPKAEILYIPFLAFFVFFYGRGLLLLLLYLLRRFPANYYDARKYGQNKYVFWALAIAVLASIDYIAKFGIQFYPFGYIFMTCYVVILAYAIVAHQLMDIEVIIKKTLVFAGLLASVFAILILPTLIIQEYLLRGAGTTARLIGLTISGIIIIVTMRRIETFLVNVTDKYLFQKKYNYKELLRTFTGEVLTVLDMDSLVNLTVNKLSDIVKLTSCAVLLLDEDKQQFNVMASQGIKDPTVTLVRPDGIVTFLEQTHGYLLRSDLAEKKVLIPDSIQEIIAKLNAELIIPMVLHEEVMGVLSLGKKKSDESYTQDDLDILLPLAKTLAIAISNAKLFVELGKTQAEAAQKEKMAVIGTLSAGINHEICNPLGIARGQCEAFLLNIKDGLYKEIKTDDLLEKAKEIMRKVIKETDRATAITKKLSTFAKPAKGESELVTIEKEIDDVIGLVGYELKLEKIEIVKNLQDNLPNIMVDRKQFQEVLFNLIRNAGQAIGEKGKVTVTGYKEKGRVFIDIQDTGSGIPEDKLKMLFNPFFTTKEPGKGTGLGLFIVRQVVEKNGGKIYLKSSKVGEGTTFTIEFPMATAEKVKV
ncbi:MAG: ATP-binding protein [Candidatus Omnitrophota bacterium]